MTPQIRLLGMVCPLALGLLAITGCKGPLERSAEQELHDQLIASHRAFLGQAAAGPVIELSRPPSEVDKELNDERRAELDRISGSEAYKNQPLKLGPDLQGNTESQSVRMSLQRVVQMAAKNNLDVQQAQLTPAINQTQVTQSEAAFDAVFFSNFSLNNLDTPRPPNSLSNALGGQTDSLATGIRKNLSSGAQVVAQTSFTRNWNDPSIYSVRQYYNSDLSLSITQPLLRGFGSDVNRAQIILSQSARRSSVQELRRSLIETVANAETAYWRLYYARQRLLIQEKLLDRTIDDFKRIKQREGFDVNPVRKTEAGSFVELRRVQVIQARQDVRVASDALKRLVNSPDLPLSSETMIDPIEAPADLPVKFSLLDAVTTALRSRPELQRALYQISDTSVRLRVADNLRLPQLNVSATMRYNGLDNSLGASYSRLTEAQYIDYILGAQFEMPIGNRGPEALFQQRTLERKQASVVYQRASQDVVLEVKEALRKLLTSYELIGAARAARRAAADNLRAIERQEEAGVALTPEFLLDLKLSSQQRLADAETQEIGAITDYNTAIANFYRTMGTLLERNGIDFKDPEEAAGVQ